MDIEKKESRSSERSVHVPEEIIEAEIVSRLPVKSVLRLRCVSKAWRCLIDSEVFTKRHLQLSTRNKGRSKVIFREGGPGKGRLKQCDLQAFLNERAAVASDVRCGGDDWSIVGVTGYCNGLVLLWNSRWRYVLWNPWTGIFKELPETGRVGQTYGHPVLGWDESSGEYMVCAFKDDLDDKLHTCRVYSSKRNSWNSLKERMDLHRVFGEGQFVSGKAHWMRVRSLLSSKTDHIVTLDMKSGVFGVMELPFDRDPEYWSTRLGVLGGCLCVILFSVPMRLHMWVLKQYGVKESWVKIIDDVPFVRIEHGVAAPAPNGEIFCTCSLGFLVYDPKQKPLKEIKIFEFVHIWDQTLVNPYLLH